MHRLEHLHKEMYRGSPFHEEEQKSIAGGFIHKQKVAAPAVTMNVT